MSVATHDPVTHDALAGYLRRRGWRHGTPGAYGALWAVGDSEPVGITHNITSQSPEWGIVVERIAHAMRVDPSQVQRDLLHLEVDEIDFSAEGSAPDSIGVEDGTRLFEMAKTSVRTTATTSRGAKPFIRGKYSKGGDAITEQVRFGHTRPGSYVVPVLYHVGPPTLAEKGQDDLTKELAKVAAENAESDQRRASRTLIQAFAALDVYVVQPASEPKREVATPLARAGVSREMVNGIIEFLGRTDEVSAVKTEVSWAGGLKTPVAPSQVTIEAEATHLLKVTAKYLRITPSRDNEHVTGPIVGLKVLDPGHDRSGGVPSMVEVQTIRRGQQSRVGIRVPAHQWDNVNEWLRVGEVVSAYGLVQQTPRGLELNLEGDLVALGQEFLQAD